MVLCQPCEWASYVGCERRARHLGLAAELVIAANPYVLGLNHAARIVCDVEGGVVSLGHLRARPRDDAASWYGRIGRAGASASHHREREHVLGVSRTRCVGALPLQDVYLSSRPAVPSGTVAYPMDARLYTPALPFRNNVPRDSASQKKHTL